MRFIFLILCFWPIGLFAENAKIQASIHPLQSIVANLTKDIKEIGLIVDQNESLHNCYLKPTQASSIYNSKMIIIIDKNFEIFLKKSLDNLDSKKTKVIEVAKLPGVELLEDDGEHEHGHEEHGHQHGMYDYHIWLDIDNVKSISQALVNIFVDSDPKNASKYRDNLAEFLVKLDKLDVDIKAKLDQVTEHKFIVAHNAYQYYIDRYDLEQPYALSIDHDHNIGAKEFIKIQNSIKNNSVKCIFEEPQFESKIIDKIKKDSKLRVCKLDAEWGPDNASVEDAYIMMMNELTDSFYNCLK